MFKVTEMIHSLIQVKILVIVLDSELELIIGMKMQIEMGTLLAVIHIWMTLVSDIMSSMLLGKIQDFMSKQRIQIHILDPMVHCIIADLGKSHVDILQYKKIWMVLIGKAIL